MKIFFEKNRFPFECFYIGDNSYFINFGLVFCPCNNEIFIPKNNGLFLRAAVDKESVNTNVFKIQSENSSGAICLEIQIKSPEDYYSQKIQEWEESWQSKKSALLEEYIDSNFPSQLAKYITYTNESDNEKIFSPLFVLDATFSPLVHYNPPIENVNIKYIECDIEKAEDDDIFNFFINNETTSEDTIKLIPIALINNSNKEIIQILDIDYCFSFPCLFSQSLSKNFLKE